MISYVTFLEISNTDGIFKKIDSQAKALSLIFGKCLLFSYYKENFAVSTYVKGKFNHKEILNNINNIKSKKHIFKSIKEYLLINGGMKNLYYRHHIPTISLIKFIKSFNKIYYEIPTYPYMFEQLYNSRHKFKTSIRLLNDIFFYPFIYKYSTKFLIVKSRKNVKLCSKMTPIRNSISNPDQYSINNRPIGSSIKIIGVGTVYPYHGYDILINALSKYNLTNTSKVYFDIVGESYEIEKLKKLVNSLNISNFVHFLGSKTSVELLSIYPKYNLGAGTIALFRRNADIDTALKNYEYMLNGLPILTSGIVDGLSENLHYYKINKNIDFNLISKFIDNFYNKFSQNDLINLIKQFTWKKEYEKAEVKK